MADVKVYIKGKLAKKGKALKSKRMQQFNTLKNSKQEVLNELHDHTYEQAIELDDAGAHFEVGTSTGKTPWFEGRRVVELDVLSQNMNCIKCNSWLRLHDIMDEVICGMASLLYIKCSSSLCQYVNTVPTGKRSYNRSFDVNSKAYLGNFFLYLPYIYGL